MTRTTVLNCELACYSGSAAAESLFETGSAAIGGMLAILDYLAGIAGTAEIAVVGVVVVVVVFVDLFVEEIVVGAFVS